MADFADALRFGDEDIALAVYGHIFRVVESGFRGASIVAGRHRETVSCNGGSVCAVKADLCDDRIVLRIDQRGERHWCRIVGDKKVSGVRIE